MECLEVLECQNIETLLLSLKVVCGGGGAREKLGICLLAIKKSRINCYEIYEYCHTKITIFQLFTVCLLCLCLEFEKQT